MVVVEAMVLLGLAVVAGRAKTRNDALNQYVRH